MKLIGSTGRTLNYVTRTTEETGMWTEKIICDVLGVRFKSKRNYFKTDYPMNLKKDISRLKSILHSLNIMNHIGNRNKSYDFETINGSTVSVKTNTSGYMVCPQDIGQPSLKMFNAKVGKLFDVEIKAKEDFKTFVLSNLKPMLDVYLKNVFCCDHLLYVVYKEGIVHHFEKTGEIRLDAVTLTTTQDIQSWNESNSVSVMINGRKNPLCNFQVHNNRDCVKCRFNMKTIMSLIESGLLTGLLVNSHQLINQYNIEVSKPKYDSY